MKAGIVLDTSAIIDLEQTYRKGKGGTRRYNDSWRFITDLRATADDGAKLFVPPQIEKEVKEHHYEVRINNHPEVSAATVLHLEKYCTKLDLEALLPSNDDSVMEYDSFRYFMRQLYNSRIEGKKKDIDPISRADWEVVDWSYALRNLGSQKNSEAFPQIFRSEYRIAVLSSDKHILAPIRWSFEEPEGVENIGLLMPLNIRNYELYRE